MVAWVAPSLGCDARVPPILSAGLPSVVASLPVFIHGGDVFDLGMAAEAADGVAGKLDLSQ